MKLAVPPVKAAALDMGLVVHQPVKVRTGNLEEWLQARGAEAVIVLAYGRILPSAVLQAPRLGCINLHASLLPRYRGAAPINWAIIRGETETGISLMKMDEGLDTGPVFCQRAVPIGPETTAGELSEVLADLAGTVIREDLPRVLAGALPPTPQDDALATQAPPIERPMTRISWDAPAGAIHDLVRGLAPRPGATTLLRGKLLKVHRTHPHPDHSCEGAPVGTVVRADKGGVEVATAAGTLSILEAQPDGRKARSARDLVNGRAISVGDVLGEPPSS